MQCVVRQCVVRRAIARRPRYVIFPTNAIRWHSASSNDDGRSGDGKDGRKVLSPSLPIPKKPDVEDKSVIKKWSLEWIANDADLDRIFEQNAEWMERVKESDPAFFDKLGAPQEPRYMYIGCSDSRVPANQIMGMPPGHVFVHRNVANLVVNTDLNLLSCLQYAVEVLDVRHILVTGHYGCGGVTQATKTESAGGVIDAWLRNIRDVARLHQAELDAIEDAEMRTRRLVELNVTEQCLNLYKTDIVQKKRLETWLDPTKSYAYPRIHGMVFDPCEGRLQKLPIDFHGHITQYKQIYDLFNVDGEVHQQDGDQRKTLAKGHYMLKKPIAGKEG